MSLNRKKKFYRGMVCVLMLPVDFFRLMVDAWTFTLEGFHYKFILQLEDQPCIYCRGCDSGMTPRPMNKKIKYWNFWMLRMLHPDLKLVEARNRLNKIPYCKNEGGYMCMPGYIPVIAVGATLLWIAIAWGGVACGQWLMSVAFGR